MAQRKAHEVDAWIARPDPHTKLVLIYGPDRGLVAERARRFAAGQGIPLDDPFSVVKLDANGLSGDPGRLVDEARTVAMFAARRLIWVTEIANDKALADAVKDLLASPPSDATVLIEAGDLKKNSALRSAVEAGSGAMALPCYADDARAIDRLIDEELGRAGLSITLEARAALKSSLGGDRLATRNELDKLVLYSVGKQRFDVTDVRAATGDASGVTADDVVDSVIGGQVAEFDAAFATLLGAGGAPATLLSAAQRQFATLLALRDAMERDGKSASAAVASARPPIFFGRKALIEQALGGSGVASLTRMAERLQAAVLETRRRPELARAAARQALLAIAVEMGRKRSGLRD